MIYRNAILLGALFFLLTNFKSGAQRTKLPADTQPVSRPILLLMPFPEEMYLSDAEPDIMRASNQLPEVYRPFFREQLNREIARALGVDFVVRNAMHDTLLAPRLNDWYDQCGYVYMPVKQSDERTKTKFRLSLRGDSVQAKNPDQHSARSYHPVADENMNFMHCRADDSLWVLDFCRPFTGEYIVSINQFEIKTHYSQCVDISRQLYKREVRIHYSVYSKDGVLVYGNYLSSIFNSGMNRYEDIAEQVFPDVALSLKRQIGDLPKR